MSKYYVGITICESWGKFANFLSDMGERPEGMTLDRVNNAGNYEPSNCRWATKGEQRRNRRDVRFYTYNGKTMCLTDWIREVTGNPKFVLKFSLEQALKNRE